MKSKFIKNTRHCNKHQMKTHDKVDLAMVMDDSSLSVSLVSEFVHF